MKKAFTMIELIFVIVIIGILSALAMPKLLGIKDQAHAAKAIEFVGALNSIVLPDLYAKAVVAGAHENSTAPKHALTNLSANVRDVAAFAKLMEIPKNFVMSDIDTDTMGATNGVPSKPLFVNATNSIKIWCKDGNTTEFPRCWYNATNTNPTVANDDLNVSKASF